MDLNVSPDLDAFWCYAVVVILGAFVAVRQINQRLGERPGIWRFGETWSLFAGYVIVPVMLFWLLDRTGAINDTSLFGAVLVGFGYERILAGGDQSVRLSGDVSQFWAPFLAYANRVGNRVSEKIERHNARLADGIVRSVAEKPERLETLTELAKKFAPDVKVLEEQLGEIDATKEIRGESAVLEQKTRLLYGFLIKAPDGHELMREKKIISEWFYWWHIRGMAPAARFAVIGVVAAAVIIAGILSFKPTVGGALGTYYVWRIGKPGTTSFDQFRARQQLFTLLADGKKKAGTTHQLTSLVRQPGLPMERVELALQVLLENRGAIAGKPELPDLLLHSLRGSSVDARVRVHDALKFLAEYCKAPIGQDLLDWKPSNGDGIAALEQKVRSWSAYWSRPCDAAA